MKDSPACSHALPCSSRALPSGRWRWRIKPTFSIKDWWIGLHVNDREVGFSWFFQPFPCLGFVVSKEWILVPVSVRCRVVADNGDGTMTLEDVE
ncbi:hypothetical protein [Rubripirellula reticaptiva]|uniref:hypothetical protein n=1 Tax=Rubripirellula reticaptiva TaxID=2528013 RepID=UPI0016495335|nr:hypothetical protein [Rubripirellula reticaptiva]